MLLMCDVDSTLYDFNRVASDVGMEIGIEWPDEYYYWFNPADIGCTLEQVTKLFRKVHSREMVLQQTPYDEAATTLNSIFDEVPELEIWYVSNRNAQAASALSEWLTNHGFPASQNVLCTRDKRDWIRENQPSVVIDDRVQTMIMARFEAGADVISVKQPYNVNLVNEIEGIYICDDWTAIGDVLSELLVQVVHG